jgi:CRP/FNR family transcriptional regulator, cyclic AMP receptor protein
MPVMGNAAGIPEAARETPMTEGMRMRHVDDPKIRRLGEVALFRHCSAKELAGLASITDQAVLETGQVLCRQGEVATAAYVIDDGQATVKVGEHVIGSVGAGESVGEMGLLDYRPRSATVVAGTPMKVYVIDARRFESVLEDTPTLARNLLRELTGRIRDLDRARADDVAA